MKNHHYKVKVEWKGNLGSGTNSYNSYSRNHTIKAEGKYDGIQASSDPSFLGDKTQYNPEELFLSSLSACHMLWYLHLCSIHKIVVIHYHDEATGMMEEDERGSGRFTQVTLHPVVIVTEIDMISKANELHEEANKMCFIANSCNFKIGHIPSTKVN
jgi:organic hydroperoxide reductase OsmC/OhrA